MKYLFILMCLHLINADVFCQQSDVINLEILKARERIINDFGYLEGFIFKNEKVYISNSNVISVCGEYKVNSTKTYHKYYVSKGIRLSSEKESISRELWDMNCNTGHKSNIDSWTKFNTDSNVVFSIDFIQSTLYMKCENKIPSIYINTDMPIILEEPDFVKHHIMGNTSQWELIDKHTMKIQMNQKDFKTIASVIKFNHNDLITGYGVFSTKGLKDSIIQLYSICPNEFWKNNLLENF